MNASLLKPSVGFRVGAGEARPVIAGHLPPVYSVMTA